MESFDMQQYADRQKKIVRQFIFHCTSENNAFEPERGVQCSFAYNYVRDMARSSWYWKQNADKRLAKCTAWVRDAARRDNNTEITTLKLEQAVDAAQNANAEAELYNDLHTFHVNLFETIATELYEGGMHWIDTRFAAPGQKPRDNTQTDAQQRAAELLAKLDAA